MGTPDTETADRAVAYGRPRDPPGEDALRDGYEPGDAKATSIGKAMAIGVVTIAASIVGLFVLLGVFHARDADRPPLTAEQGAAIAPPGPPLQASPQADLAAFRAQETQKLNTYRWLDPAHGHAQIPIERAMALVLGQPLDPADGGADKRK